MTQVEKDETKRNRTENGTQNHIVELIAECWDEEFFQTIHFLTTIHKK